MTLHTLLQGHETADRIKYLLELTSISSPSVRSALHDHYVDGLAVEMCVMKYDLPRQNFTRAVKKLNRVYSLACAVCGVA
jgi:hypothetical protein